MHLRWRHERRIGENTGTKYNQIIVSILKKSVKLTSTVATLNMSSLLYWTRHSVNKVPLNNSGIWQQDDGCNLGAVV